MFQGRKGILVLITALFIVAFAGLSYAAEIDGLTSGTPSTVFVNPGGLGQALLYNYYNARDNVTYFTVVNTDTVNGARVRVRFREGADVAENGTCSPEVPLGSFEVFDFDICLSKGDMWTGHIMKNDSTEGGMLCADDVDTLVWDNVTSDIFEKVFASTGGCAQFKFLGNNPLASGNITADHTLEGYFEIIAENQIDAEPITCVPATDLSATRPMVGNVLFGNVAMIEQTIGSTYSYDATALADWKTVGNAFSALTTSLPDLTSGTEGLTAVNYVLTKEQLYSIYDLIGTETEHVITLPTKLLTFQASQCAATLFDDLSALYSIWSADEQLNTPQGCSGSPCAGAPTAELPFEVNVVALGGSDFLTMGGAGASTLTALPTPFDFGWISINLNGKSLNAGVVTPPTPVHSTVAPNATGTSFGWPALGLTLMNIDNGVSVGTFPMQFSTNIQ